MLYIRSSFIDYCVKQHDCLVAPLPNGTGVQIKNGSAKFYMNWKETIAYEEIVTVCTKLYIPLAGDKDLEKAE